MTSRQAGSHLPAGSGTFMLYFRVFPARAGSSRLLTFRGAQRKRRSRRKPAFTVFSGRAGSRRLTPASGTVEWGRLNPGNVRESALLSTFLTYSEGP